MPNISANCCWLVLAIVAIIGCLIIYYRSEFTNGENFSTASWQNWLRNYWQAQKLQLAAAPPVIIGAVQLPKRTQIIPGDYGANPYGPRMCQQMCRNNAGCTVASLDGTGNCMLSYY